MISSDSNICLLLKSKDEVDFYERILKGLNFNKFKSFTDSDEAYEHVIRNQFELFITRMEVSPMSGLVFIQKIRETGNYGLESHLFIADKVSGDHICTLQDLDLPYVLVKPFTVDRVEEKLNYMSKIENNLTEFEEGYRNAKTAFFNKLDDMALELTKSLVDANPDNPKARLLLGDIYLHKEDYDQAQRCFEHVLEKDPKSGPSKIRMAKILMARNNFLDASQHLNDLAKVNPHHIKVLENAGLSNFEIKEYKTAKKHMKQLVAIDKDNLVAQQIETKVEFRSGNIAASLPKLKETMTDSELIYFANNEALRVLNETEDTKAAVAVFEEVLSEVHENVFRYVLYFNAGQLYWKMGDLDSARKAFIKAIEINPNYDKPRHALKKLREKIKEEQQSSPKASA
ncbi:tetratricopeptide repeat protein [Pseudobacteriovorax antillogorgiicola]|uniref:Response regulator receiver domain-containing protein n=1 Tax=Pseudobacteriovorax antillogorgiicola TaxID=1513793 RepID=A0A1Y6BGB3_9BACT|nr:tetratricopeptide repeat protein [Pseudobacteriovorax antillogorgiicola]TCS57522.1 response regulator receiver domain-containing protein [Pseudobacteriovorax antillogorgiicola]SMF00090.1 Response regulator receiver domain-containing protein [Pseudobacteriovorax antillogorgiicola]